MSSRLQAAWRRRARRLLDVRLVHWLRLGRTQQAWYLRRLFAWQSIDLVLDVGANAGQFARFLREHVRYHGWIISFEPLPQLLPELQRLAAADGRWRIIPKALGSEPAVRLLNVMNTSEMSSLLAPNDECESWLMNYNRVEAQVEIDVETLDRVLVGELASFRSDNIYLKLDVQGYEQQALAGAKRALSRVAALQLELNVEALYAGQPPYWELMRELEAAGFQLSLLPAHEYEHFPAMIDFDAHFVRRSRLKRSWGDST